jgi:hypothetical protein
MRGLEKEVTPAKYLAQWAKRSVGIDAALRARKEKDCEGKMVSNGFFEGFSQFLYPSTKQLEESREENNIKLRNPKEIIKMSSTAVLDIASWLPSELFLTKDYLWQVIVIKLGYNFVSQIAPDVARLAKKTALKIRDKNRLRLK